MENNVKEMNGKVMNYEKAFEFLKKAGSMAIGLTLIDFMLKHLYL